jgi:hypothetical protein
MLFFSALGEIDQLSQTKAKLEDALQRTEQKLHSVCTSTGVDSPSFAKEAQGESAILEISD